MDNVYEGMIVRRKKDGNIFIVDEIQKEYVLFHELNNKFGYTQKSTLRFFLDDFELSR